MHPYWCGMNFVMALNQAEYIHKKRPLNMGAFYYMYIQKNKKAGKKYPFLEVLNLTTKVKRRYSNMSEYNYSQKEKVFMFLDTVFPIIKEHEYMGLQYKLKDGTMSKVNTFQTNQDAINFANKNRGKDIYYLIATTMCENKRVKDLVSTSAIVLDFDFKNGKKKPSPKEFRSRLNKKLKLDIPVLIDTGHGYQLVIATARTYSATT